jgi:hypothetical protein
MALYPLAAAARRADRPTRTSRRFSVLVIPVWGEPLELGRSGRTMGAAAGASYGVADRAYYESPGRKSVSWDPAPFIIAHELRILREVLFH